MTREYDDDAVLTDYIFHNYGSLMSTPEQLATKAAEMRLKAEAYGDCSVSSRLRVMQRELASEPGVVDFLSLPFPEFRRRVRDRVLEQHADEVNLNRCSRCGRIPRTPEAKQCPWCHHSWRDGA